MNDWWLLFGYGVGYLAVMMINAFIPYLSRKTECFGVSIPAEVYDHPGLTRLRRQYRFRVLAAGLVVGGGLGGLFTQSPAAAWSSLGGYGTGAQVAVGFLWYFWGHRQTKKLKKVEGWDTSHPAQVVADTSFRRRRITVSPWWFSGYFLLIAATVLLGVYHYERLPGEIPFFFDAWRSRLLPKSPRILWLIPVAQIASTGMILLLYRIIDRARQEVDPADPERSLEQNRIFRYRWSGFVIGVGYLMAGLTGLPLLTGLAERNTVMTVNAITMAIISIWAVWLVVTTGQGGSRLGKAKSAGTGKAAYRDEDRFWFLGLFYANPGDPTLIVERRFGIGWTLNFGRWESWAIMAGVAVVVLVVQWVTK